MAKPFLDIKINPFWEKVRSLLTKLTFPSGTSIEIIIPDNFTPAAYCKIHAQVTEKGEGEGEISAEDG